MDGLSSDKMKTSQGPGDHQDTQTGDVRRHQGRKNKTKGHDLGGENRATDVKSGGEYTSGWVIPFGTLELGGF